MGRLCLGPWAVPVSIDRNPLVTPKGHLDQGLRTHSDGSWAAANGQLRTFSESLIDEIALRLDPQNVSARSPVVFTKKGQGRRYKQEHRSRSFHRFQTRNKEFGSLDLHVVSSVPLSSFQTGDGHYYGVVPISETSG